MNLAEQDIDRSPGSPSLLHGMILSVYPQLQGFYPGSTSARRQGSQTLLQSRKKWMEYNFLWPDRSHTNLSQKEEGRISSMVRIKRYIKSTWSLRSATV